MLQSLTLTNFRAYHNKQIDFEPGMNIITGPNGSGKTTILEGLYMLVAGASFRSDTEATIRHGAAWSRLDMSYGDDIYTLKHAPSSREKILFKNEDRVAKSGLYTLLFEPEQLRIIHGPPDLRRRWLDDIIVAAIPGYNHTLTGYSRALRQRNALLTHGNFHKDDMFVWDVKLAEYGAAIALRRRDQIEQFNYLISERYHDISGTKQQVQLVYESPFGADYGSEFLRSLHDRLALDRTRGFTSRGPHRDDIVFLLDGHPAAETASRGERRSLYVALKLLEYDQLAQKTGLLPLLLFDDVFAEFDERHKRLLTSFKTESQIVITTIENNISDYSQAHIITTS